MLREVIRRIREHPQLSGMPLATPAEAGDYEGRAELGLRQFMPSEPRYTLRGLVGYPVLAHFRTTFGITIDADVFNVLNFVGYRYFDLGAKITAIDRSHAEYRARRGIATVFLPQAYGPFSTPGLRSDAKRLFSTARLVYARDHHSADLVAELGVRRPEVVPDITLGTPHVASPRPDLAGHVCLIPNLWMVERTESSESLAYLDFMVNLIDFSCRSGFKSFVLCHTPFQDDALSKRLVALYGRPIEYVTEPDPHRAKAIVGTCRLVIGSRYHGLLAALSQNVPVLATTWAHKYPELLRDYGVPELLVRAGETERAQTLVAELLDNDRRGRYVEAISAANVALRPRIEEMWERVLGILTQTLAAQR